MLNFQNKIELKPRLSRVYFDCYVCGRLQTILFDPGSPNTVITLELAKFLGLKSYRSHMIKIRIAGGVIDVVPVTIPELRMGSLVIKNVKVYAGLDKGWGNTVLLGLNVLNHLIYTVDRTEDNGFINLEFNRNCKGSEQEIFNRLISADGKYYISDFDENEILLL